MTLPVAIELGMLEEADLESVLALSDELCSAYRCRQIFRTETEARISVLDNLRHPTNASKFWQAMREQVSMLEQLAVASFEYRRNEVVLKRYQQTVKNAANALDAEEAEIGIDECLFKRAGLQTVAADRAREIRMWSMLKKELDTGAFSTTDADAHQLVSYTAQFAMKASTVQPGQMSSDEFANLAGQLQTAVQRCKDTGAEDALISALPAKVAAQLQLKAG